MANISVDFEKINGKIKPLHGVGQPPLYAGAKLFSRFHYLTESGAPY